MSGLSPSPSLTVVRAARVAVLALMVVRGDLVAQVIRGRVAEFRSDLPIAQAHIALLDEKQQETPIVTTTDSLGRYSIVVSVPGRYFVRARQTGYDQYVSIQKSVGARDTVALDLWPQANADLLDSLLKVIKPGVAPSTPEGKAFDRRLRSHLGHVIVRERIANQRYYDLEEVITRAFDGVQVQRSRGDLMSVCYRGCCTFAVYRNGVRSFAMTGSRTSVLQLQSVLSTRAEGLFAIEFYVGDNEMPAEYFGETPAACGVLGYWTKPPM